MGNTGSASFSTDDVDCDPSSVTFTVSPAPVGTVNIVGNDVVFNTVANPGGDGGILYTVTLTVSDGVDESSCEVQFDVLETEPYEVQIEKTHNTLQGMHVIVDVTQNKGSEAMGGYDFMIA